MDQQLDFDLGEIDHVASWTALDHHYCDRPLDPLRWRLDGQSTISRGRPECRLWRRGGPRRRLRRGRGLPGAQFANPYYGTGFYGPYIEDPLSGFLSGTANVIGAQGQWMKDVQSADMTKEQVRQTKIDTRRKNFDEWQYERKNTPTFEDDREHFRMEDWRRSRNDPPLSEIWSGESLNFLLDQAQHMQAQQGPGPTVELDPEVLSHINVNSGPTAGNVGLLKDGGKLRWPLTLRASPYQEDRQQLDTLLPKAIKQAASGNQVDADALNDMLAGVSDLNAKIKQNIDSLTPNDYSSAKQISARAGERDQDARESECIQVPERPVVRERRDRGPTGERHDPQGTSLRAGHAGRPSGLRRPATCPRRLRHGLRADDREAVGRIAA